MSKVTKIKYCDEYGYQIAELDVGGVDEMANIAYSFTDAISRFGITAQQAAEAISRVSEALARIDHLEYQTSRLNGTECTFNSKITKVNSDIAALRSGMNALTETLKQKDDLEISNQIVPDPDFLRLEQNIFLRDSEDYHEWLKIQD